MNNQSEQTFTVKGAGLAKAHRVFKAMIETSDGFWILGPEHIHLQLAGRTIARIEVTDSNLWAEMVKDLVRPQGQAAVHSVMGEES